MNIEEENIKELGIMCENLKSLREAKNWSVGKLSEISGISAEVLIAIENGEDFDIRYLIELCRIHHIKPHKIFSQT